MAWSFTNLVVQIICGLIGGHIAMAAAHEHSLGRTSKTLLGAAGGAIGGIFLQTFASTMVNSNGDAATPLRRAP